MATKIGTVINKKKMLPRYSTEGELIPAFAFGKMNADKAAIFCNFNDQGLSVVKPATHSSKNNATIPNFSAADGRKVRIDDDNPDGIQSEGFGLPWWSVAEELSPIQWNVNGKIRGLLTGSWNRYHRLECCIHTSDLQEMLSESPVILVQSFSISDASRLQKLRSSRSRTNTTHLPKALRTLRQLATKASQRATAQISTSVDHSGKIFDQYQHHSGSGDEPMEN